MRRVLTPESEGYTVDLLNGLHGDVVSAGG